MSLRVFISGPYKKVNLLLLFPLVRCFTSEILRLVYTSKHKSVRCLVKLKFFSRTNLMIADNIPSSFDKLDFYKNIASITTISTLFGD